jgi:hypothetical protein
MRYTTLSAVSLSCLLLAACDKDPSGGTTAPDVRYIQTTSIPCDAALGRTIAQQQNSLFSRATLTAARAAWEPVTTDCAGNLSQAKEEMLAYVQFTIDQFRLGNVDAPRQGTRESALVAHWNYVFSYVGYPAPNLPASVLGAEGAIGVITQSTVNREIAAAHAAVTIPVQLATGDQRGHLISIYPIPGGCLTGTNLKQHGPCFDFASNPAAFPKFDDPAKIGVCQPVHATDVLPGNSPALGHLQDDGTTTITAATGIYPTFCPHDLYIGSWTGGISDLATRLAYLTGRVLGVKTAYAVNGGLGGLDTDLSSPFGNVDLLVFKATFTANAIGSTIVTGDTADVGTWTSSVTPPGSITVQSSLGDLTTQPVVLSQGGGNCANCGGLLLQGNLASSSPSTFATTGKYRVEWYSLQDAPSVKGAPFVLRGSTGQELARVTYATVSSANVLSYNGGTPFGTWTRHVTQHFEILVDLDANTTSLTVDGTPIVSNQQFVCLNAPASCTAATVDFKSIAAEFSGIDSGIMGWDNISVTRLSDQ